MEAMSRTSNLNFFFFFFVNPYRPKKSNPRFLKNPICPPLLAPSNLITEFCKFNNSNFLSQGFEPEFFNWTFE